MTDIQTDICNSRVAFAFLHGSTENLSHKTKTAAALSAETLCKSSVLNIVPYEINQNENYSEWKKNV